MKRSIKYENAEGNQNDREVLYCTRSNESILRLARITNKVVMCTKCKSLLNVEETWSEFEDKLVSSATSDVSMSSIDLLVTLKAKHAYVSQLNGAGEGIWKVGDTLYITGNSKCLTPAVEAEINCSLISGKFDLKVRKKVLSILKDAAKDSLIGISSVSRCETLSDESDDLESVSSLAPAERRMLQHALVEGAPLTKKARYSPESPDVSKPLTSTAKQSPYNTATSTSTPLTDNSTTSTLLGSNKAPVASAASTSRFQPNNPLPVVRTTNTPNSATTANTTLTTTMSSSFSATITPTRNADTGLIDSTSAAPLVTAPTTPATQGTVYRDSFSARPPAPTVSGVVSEGCGDSASSDKFTAFLDILRKNAPPDIHSLHLPSLPSITPAGCTEQAVTELNVSTSKTPLAPTTPTQVTQHSDHSPRSDDSSLCTAESTLPSLTSSRHKLSCYSSRTLSSSSEEDTDTAGRRLFGRSTLPSAPRESVCSVPPCVSKTPTPTTINTSMSTANTTSTSSGRIFGLYVPPTLRKEANTHCSLPFASSVPPRASHTFAKATPLGSGYTISPAWISSTRNPFGLLAQRPALSETEEHPLPAVSSASLLAAGTSAVDSLCMTYTLTTSANTSTTTATSTSDTNTVLIDSTSTAPVVTAPTTPALAAQHSEATYQPPLPSTTPTMSERRQAPPPAGSTEEAEELRRVRSRAINDNHEKDVGVEHRDTFPVWPPPSTISSAASEGCGASASSKQFAAAFLDVLRKNAPPDIHFSHPPPLPSITPVAPRQLGFVDSLQTSPSLSFPSAPPNIHPLFPPPLPVLTPTYRLLQTPPSVRCTEEAEVRGKSDVAGVDRTDAFSIGPPAPEVSSAASAGCGVNGESKVQTTDLHSLPLPPPPVLYAERHQWTGIELHADSVQTLRNLSNFLDGRICRDTQRNLKEKTHTMPIHVYRGAYSLPRGQWTGVVLDLSRYSLMDESLFITLWNTEISNAMDRLKVNAFTRFKL